MKKWKTLLALFLVYFIVAVPFRVMGVIPGFTDVRPVALLGPIYAVFFGVPGCWVMAVGNLVMDIVGSSLRWSSIPGFAANFLGPYLIYWLCVRRAKIPFALRKGRELLKHCWVILLSAALQTLLITPAVAWIYPEVDAGFFALIVMLNDTAFPIVFGIPIMILLQEKLGFRPLTKEKEMIE